MTREELDFIGSMNMCDEISNEAYKKIVCHCGEQEPCKDAISRQAVIDAIDKWVKVEHILETLPTDKVTPLFKSVHKLPPVNPQPKTGHWEYSEQLSENVCSVCGNLAYWNEDEELLTDYCPNCGAKMIEPQESEVQK